MRDFPFGSGWSGRRLASLGLMAGLVACAPVPQRDAAPASSPAPQQTKSVAAPVAPGCAVAGECAAIAAKTAFGNVLTKAVFIAPEVAQARADLTAARAALQAAQKGLQPQLGLEARAEGAASVAVLALRQPIWSAGKLRAAIVEAEAAVQQSQAALEQVQLEAGLRLIDAVGRWVETDAAARALADVLVEYDDTLAMVQRRADEGVASGSEVELVAARRASVLADIASAGAARDLARASLTSLLGAEIGGGVLEGAMAGTGAVPLPASGDLDRLVAQSPALRVADAAIARAGAGLASARADRFPTLSLVGEQQLTEGGGTGDGRVYLGLTANIGPGRAGASRIAAAQAQVEGLTAARAIKARALRDELTALDLRHRAAVDRLAAADNAISASGAVLASYRKQMAEAGSKSWQDILAATREATDARRARASAQAELVTTYWKLKAYTAGLGGL